MAKRGVSRLWTIKRRFIRPPLTLPISIRLIANGMPMRLSRHLSWLTVTAVDTIEASLPAVVTVMAGWTVSRVRSVL